MALMPLRAAKIPPVAAPLTIEFQESSLCRYEIMTQSTVLKVAPQMAKLPAMDGVRNFTDSKPPYRPRRKPVGALRKPFRYSNNDPPTVPIIKAHPQSSTILMGQGWRLYSMITPHLHRFRGRLIVCPL